MGGNFSLGVCDSLTGRKQRIREIALHEDGETYRIRLRPRLVIGTCMGYAGRIVHHPGWVHHCTTMDARVAAYEVLAAFLSHREEKALTPTSESTTVQPTTKG